jgi:hypothetical protein
MVLFFKIFYILDWFFFFTRLFFSLKSEFHERVWQCGCGCFSNSFSCWNACQWFFYFLKIIFDISTSKRSKKYKLHLILTKKKNQIWTKHKYKHITKHSRMMRLHETVLGDESGSALFLLFSKYFLL